MSKKNIIMFFFEVDTGLEPYLSDSSVQLPGDENIRDPSDLAYNDESAYFFLEEDESTFISSLSPDQREIFRKLMDKAFREGSTVLI